MNNKVKFFSAVIGSYVWGPIIELSFVGYLNHMFWIVIFFSTQIETPYITMTELVLNSFSILVISFFSALPFAFLWVMPSKNLVMLVTYQVDH